jgi:hypothetical protein
LRVEKDLALEDPKLEKEEEVDAEVDS